MVQKQLKEEDDRINQQRVQKEMFETAKKNFKKKDLNKVSVPSV